jgi:hypothetical protein
MSKDANMSTAQKEALRRLAVHAHRDQAMSRNLGFYDVSDSSSGITRATMGALVRRGLVEERAGNGYQTTRGWHVNTLHRITLSGLCAVETNGG